MSLLNLECQEEQRPNKNNWRDPIYDRIRSITSDQTSFTVHKFP